MHTINQNSSYKLVEKKSQFIAECFYVESKDEAENLIDSITKNITMLSIIVMLM